MLDRTTYPANALQSGLMPEADTGLVEISGVVKWFHPDKGYGFVTPDNGLPDVLLHLQCLCRYGHSIAYKGAKVVCEVEQGPKGLRVYRILSMDNSTAINPVPTPHVQIEDIGKLERAECKWFCRRGGYGFLTRGEGTNDIFVHMETLKRFHVPELTPKQSVLVRFGKGPKGLIAVEVLPDS